MASKSRHFPDSRDACRAKGMTTGGIGEGGGLGPPLNHVQYWSCPSFVDGIESRERRLPMPRAHAPYAPEYRRRIVELAREFEPSANAIREWVKQGGTRRGSAQRWPDHGRTRGAQPAAP
jgi:hypothetical protein